MATQTEKLKKKIAHIVHNGRQLDGELYRLTINETVNQILKACKEARLVFTDYSSDDEGNIILQGLGEIEWQK